MEQSTPPAEVDPPAAHPVGATFERLQHLVDAGDFEAARETAEAALERFEAVDQRIAVMAVLAQIKQHTGDTDGARSTALAASVMADDAGLMEEARALRHLADATELADPAAALNFKPLADRMMAALTGGDARAALATAEALMPLADAVGPTAVLAVCIGGATAALALGVRSIARVFLDRGEAIAQVPSDQASLARLRAVYAGPDSGLAEFAGRYALRHDRLDDAIAVLAPALPDEPGDAADAMTLHRMLAVAHFKAQRIADALEHTAKAYHIARALRDDASARALLPQVMGLKERLDEHIPSRPVLPPPARSTAAGVERILTVLRAGDLNHAHVLTTQALAETAVDDPTRVPLLSLAARLHRMAGDTPAARAALAEARALVTAAGGGPVLQALDAHLGLLTDG